VSNSTATAAPGQHAFAAATFDFAASTCGDVEVREMDMRLMSVNDALGDFSAICAGSCFDNSDWNFHNAKVVAASATLMGPAEFSQSSPAVVLFHDSFTVKAGTTLRVQFVFDISNPLATNVSGKKYQTRLDNVRTNAMAENVVFSADPSETFSISP
jgi:hypothetical protein